jgi:hypothetical protein
MRYDSAEILDFGGIASQREEKELANTLSGLLAKHRHLLNDRDSQRTDGASLCKRLVT